MGDVTTTVNPLNQTTTNVYDPLHRQIAVTNPLGNTTTTVLDGNGQTAATVDANNDGSVNIINALGQNVGNVTDLNQVTQAIQDPTGGARAEIDSSGNETDTVLDAAGRAAVNVTPTGSTTTVYDSAGRVSSTTDADGRVIQYSYNNNDQVTGEVWKNSSGATVNLQTFTYDADGNLLTAADVNGTVTYTYNANDQVSSYTNVFGQILTLTYNSNNQETKQTDSLGGVETFVYDPSNRLASEQFSGTGATGTAEDVSFGYNANSDQTTITWYSNLAGTTVVARSVYGFDSSDRMTSIVNSNSSNATLSYYTLRV